MIQNLKVDVIYHSTASDFEMEFNLCGCCRMRLLSDKTSDKKGFVKALARDVARSRIIIICGPLFGSDGIIETVATAIGNGTSVCNNKTYNINSNEEIKIINGSTPLVTNDGYFGGCIIESGPQTIILLTENKTFRKNIMQNLIHPYIEEICYIPTKTSSLPETTDVAPVEEAISEQESYVTDTDDDQTDEPEEVEMLETVNDEHNIEFIMDQEEVAETSDDNNQDESPIFDENFNLLFTEIETPEMAKERYTDSYKPSESDNMFISERETDDTKKDIQKRNSLLAMDLAVVVLILLLALAILSLIYLVILRPLTMGTDIGSYVKEIFGISGGTLV